MKILVLGETKDVRSGWGRYAHEVTQEYERRGIAYSFVSSRELLPFTRQNFIKNILLIRRLIKKDISIIHAFDVWPYAVYASLANLGLNKPFFITGVGTYSVPPKGGLKAMLMRFSLRKAKEVFCISNYTLKLLNKSEPKANLSVVHWGSSKLPVANNNKENERKFNIPEGKRPILITVGQVKHRKGQLDTLKAVNILRKKYPNILYIVVGNTDDTKYVQEIRNFAKNNNLEENFRIINNQQTDNELSYLYNLADVFVMNSNNDGLHFEGFGLVFLEAAQFGKPAVGSSGCGIEDAIVDGKTGRLSKQGDERDIAEKIEFVIENKEILGKASRERAKEFTWDATVSKYLKAYEKF